MEFTGKITGLTESFQVGLYQSEDEFFDDGDRSHQVSFVTLNPNTDQDHLYNISANEILRLPKERPFLLVVVDPNSMISEENDFTQGINNNAVALGFSPVSNIVDYIIPTSHIGERDREGYSQIVLHATACNFETAVGEFTSSPTLENISPHYLVDRDGTIYQLVPETKVANHASNPRAAVDLTGLTNQNSIGIEMVDNGESISKANWAPQRLKERTASLVRDIATRHAEILESTLNGGLWVPHPFLNPLSHLTNPDIYYEGYRFQGMDFRQVPPTGLIPYGTTPPLTPGTNAFGLSQGRGNALADGYGIDAKGVIGHGQVVDRFAKNDPGWGDLQWKEFMLLVNSPGQAFSLHSPANLIISDPFGRRSGIDPASGQILLEIPGTQFSGPGTHPQTLAFPSVPSGTYIVQVIGTGTGEFQLDILTTDQESREFSALISDSTTVGDVKTYVLRFSATNVDETNVDQASINRPPEIAPIDALILDEGNTLSLHVNASDPDADDNLTYALDVAPPGAYIDQNTGLLSWIPTDGPATIQVAIRVTDNGSPPLSDTTTFTIIANNVPPTATMSGPTSGVNGQTQVFLVSATDTSSIDQAAGFAYSIDWGDGTTFSVPQGAGNGMGVPLTHVYSSTGHFVVRTTATDKDGGTSAVLDRAIDIVQVVAIDGNVYVAGTNGNDYIEVTVGAPLATIRFGNTLLRNLHLGPSGSIHVFALAGNDTVNGGRAPRVVIFGGDGNDVLTGSGGNDLIVGGQGNDRINGGATGGNDEIWGDDYDPARDNPAIGSQATLGDNDTINTFGGNDTVYGQGGNDSIYTGAGDDYINAGGGNDTVDGQGGNDRIYGGVGNDTLAGSDGNDLVAGNGGHDTLLGSTGNNILIGGFGVDTVSGSSGRDALVGDESNGSGSGSMSKGDAADAALLALLLAWTSPAGPPVLARLGTFSSAGSDGSVDTLWGGGEADAFFGTPLDKASDRNALGYGPDLN